MFSGCNITKQHTHLLADEYTSLKNDYSEGLYMNFDDFKKYDNTQSNSVCEYYSISNVSDSKSIELCYSNISNFFDIIVLEINEHGIVISDNEVSIDAYKHYPIDIATEMTNTETVDELWGKMGQPYKYIEQNGISAMLFEDSLVLGTEGNYETISLDSNIRATRVKSMQIANDSIYLFEKITHNSQAHIAVTEIKISENPELNYTVIPFTAMGLPEIHGQILEDNIFINNNNLYFSINDYGRNSWIAAYDLESGKGTNFKIEHVTYDGKLFCYEDCIGLMVSAHNNSGYNTDIGINFFSFDSEECRLTENTKLYIEFPKDAKYIYGTIGNQFYCIDDKLCGIMHHIDDGSFAYTEIDLSDGTISAFVPFKTKLNSYILYGYTIRNNGTGVSQHNCEQ